MTDGDAPDEKFPSKFESALKTKPATGTPVPQTAHGFYLYTASSASLTLSSSNVFYWVASEQVANTLCRLCSKQYSSEGEEPVFLSKSAADVEPDEQVLLDEALDWLAVYCADPDPSVYDPAPPEGVMMRAEYAKRSGDWEFAIAERRGGESSGAASVAGTPRKRSGRPPRMAPDFVDFAGWLWRDASRQNPGSRSESKARSKVPDEALAAIASSLDSKGYVPPANYLEKHFAIQVKNYNSRNSNSKTGPIQTWSQLISVADQEHLRGMRKLLSRCAEKLKSRGPRLSGK